MSWALRTLTTMPGVGENLTFKGGTSLSKAWNLLQRFSEDLDLVVDRQLLGFGADQTPGTATSGKQRDRRLDALRTACRDWVRGPLQEALVQACRSVHAAHGLRVLAYPGDPDGSTLVLQYAPMLKDGDVAGVIPEVRLEFGARSDVEPHVVRRVSSYLHQHLPALDPDTFCDVRVLAAERTFWEKACLLHEENLRREHRTRGRLARHFYDLWCLDRGRVAERALADVGLFERVVSHRRVYFRQSWMREEDYSATAFHLVPAAERLPAWRADYELMRESMFFGETPDFDELMRRIADLEARLRSSGR